jgi:hypothetical protein
MKFTKLEIGPCGDGYIHLYLDSKLLCQGDYYHDKIEDYIKGYIDGFTYLYNISEIGQVGKTKIEVEYLNFYKDEWEYEDISGEKHLSITIRRLKNAGFEQVKNE